MFRRRSVTTAAQEANGRATKTSFCPCAVLHILSVRMANLYIRLASEEWDSLLSMAVEARRTPNEQAAYLVAQGLGRWRTQKGFEAAITAEARDGIEPLKDTA